MREQKDWLKTKHELSPVASSLPPLLGGALVTFFRKSPNCLASGGKQP